MVFPFSCLSRPSTRGTVYHKKAVQRALVKQVFCAPKARQIILKNFPHSILISHYLHKTAAILSFSSRQHGDRPHQVEQDTPFCAHRPLLSLNTEVVEKRRHGASRKRILSPRGSRPPLGPAARQIFAHRSGKLLARSRRSGLRCSLKTIGRLQPAVPRRDHGLRARPLRRQQTLAPHSRSFPPLRAYNATSSAFVTQSRRVRRELAGKLNVAAGGAAGGAAAAQAARGPEEPTGQKCDGLCAERIIFSCEHPAQPP